MNTAVDLGKDPELARLYPFEGQRLDLGGIGMHYLDEGPRDSGRPPVVMVHGNPTWSFYYRRLVARLRPHVRTVVPDHVGCGLSDKPAEGYEYTLERRVGDLGRLIDELGLETVDLVVHDWGGMIGFAWAARNPDRVRNVVVLNTGAFFLPESKGFPPALRLARVPGLGAVLVRGFSAFSRGANRFCVTRKPLEPAVARGYLAPYATWADRVAVHRFVEDIPLHPRDRAWQVVAETADRLELLADKPMLVGWGMRDFVFDHHFLAEWERRFPNAQVHRYDDAGHYVLEDAWEELAPLIENHLLGDEAGLRA